jgi:hypothetical protein
LVIYQLSSLIDKDIIHAGKDFVKPGHEEADSSKLRCTTSHAAGRGNQAGEIPKQQTTATALFLNGDKIRGETIIEEGAKSCPST